VVGASGEEEDEARAIAIVEIAPVHERRAIDECPEDVWYTLMEG